MIAQFKSIVKVGKFVGFTATSGHQYELTKRSIIFGKNTRGKSTLTAIVKSLASGNADLIVGRKTFGSTNGQKVVIKETTNAGDQIHTFDNDAWRGSMPYIRVFDAKYVRQHVHTEDAVLDEHQHQLENLILGAKGEELIRKQSEAENACKQNTERKSNLTHEYNRYLSNQTGIDFATFIKLVPDDSIQEKIDLQKQRIDSYKKYDVIKKLVNEINTQLKEWNFSDIQEALAPKLELKREAIQNHIDRNLQDKSQALDFLHHGFNQWKGDGPCPLCSQELTSDTSKHLFNELSTLFSDNYRKLRSAVQSAISKMDGFIIKQDLDHKIKRVTDLGEQLELDDPINEILLAKQRIIEEIQKKKEDLNYEFDGSLVDVLNEKINDARALLQPLLQKYATEFDIEELEKLNDQLKSLENIKERTSQRWKDNCDEYVVLASKSKTLSKERDQALTEKNDYATGVLEKYGKNINDTLKVLNAQFKVVKMQPRPTIRSKQPLYALEFNGGHEVKIGASSISETSFENTLSESDKRLLGFAFFLAEVDLDDDKSSLIVLLDDPMSSFDTERKQATAKIIDTLSTGIDQIIVLTHEEAFLKTLYKCLGDSSLFKISTGETGSQILPMDINDEYLDVHYANIIKLQRIANGDIEATADDLRCMRDIAEDVMVRKYYLTLKQNLDEGKSISSFMTTLKEANIYTDESLIADVNKLYLHFWNHDDSIKIIAREDYSTGDLQTFAADFLQVVHRL